ncbi:hypothetical protein [Reinekea sp. G2M2-21]|uniref:hypothetical protein n=1 Tax=Reinekea sp. G2M2-21 TaxID=2788942 RepID=UPI0018AA7482|nr:hypothetical protein [Reinekea sp. G2M2-21]
MKSVKRVTSALLILANIAFAETEFKAVEYLQSAIYQGRPNLLHGTIGDLEIYASLTGSEQSTLEGIYFYQKYYQYNSAEDRYSKRPIRLEGTLDGVTLEMTESVNGEITGMMTANYDPYLDAFVGSWFTPNKSKTLEFKLIPGGVLPIQKNPLVEILATADSYSLLIDKEFEIPYTSNALSPMQDYGDGGISFGKLNKLVGATAVYQLNENEFSGRSEYHQSSYYVKGIKQPIVTIEDGYGSYCAGSTGSNYDHTASIIDDKLVIRRTITDWQNCEPEDGYYQDSHSVTETTYVLNDASNVSKASELSHRNIYRSLALQPRNKPEFYLERRDDNIFWGGTSGLGEAYDVFRFFGNADSFKFNCWLNGIGNEINGTPLKERIDPVWRNLSLTESWSKFGSGKYQDIFDVKKYKWIASVNNSVTTLSLNGENLAAYDASTNKCSSLYLKQDDAEKGVYRLQ